MVPERPFRIGRQLPIQSPMGKLWALAVPLAAFALAGCGGGTSAPSTHFAPPGDAQITHAKTVVLAVSDIGNGWVTVRKETKTIGLARVAKGDPAPLKKLEKHSFRSAYQALYANNFRNGVLATVAAWDTHEHAQQVATGWGRQFARKLHAHRLSAPAGVPTDTFTMWGGRIPQNGRQVPLFAAQWVHNNAVVSVVMFGEGVHQRDLQGIITLQNGKLENA
jgi:hypothetical protein